MKANYSIKVKKHLFPKKPPHNTKKPLLTSSQKIIILIITCFMLTFTFYKIGYIIYIIKENIKLNFSKLNQNTSVIKQNTDNKEMITISNDNIQQEKENFKHIDNISNLNESIQINEDLVIPYSYGKNLEDLILNYFFADVNKGFYIDMGYFDSNKMSPTKYFYLKGWNGINIKPLDVEYQELIKERPKDINLNYYINGTTHKKYYIQELNNTNDTFHKISDVCEEFIPKNKIIHFCAINMKEDTRKILLGYDFENFRPKIFCIENNNVNYEMYEYILNKNDYSFIYQYEINRYYLDNKINDLKEKVKVDYIDGIIQSYKNRNNY